MDSNSLPHISKTKLSLYSSLTTAKMRRRTGLFTVEGWRSIEAMQRRFLPEALVVSGASNHLSLIPGKTFLADENEMKALSQLQTPPEAIAVFHIPESEAVGHLNEGLYLVLDGVRDPGNMGTILRIADWFGFDRVFLSNDCVDVYNPKCIQGAMGALGAVLPTVCSLPELFAANPTLPVYGTLLDGTDIYTTELSSRGFIVMGNEGAGLSDEVRRLVSNPLLIPSYAKGREPVESLNVGVATALVVAEFRRRFN